ncbi:hypothetical protein JAAARDRAFT_64721 [Jaapia argillacea MUCL 33604]|uniref:AB hydrolase-1 domain-containing protein n=1 Tax=Jaapia argillacea MUCL 33604 TaxID=933084 RepID=A0A067QMZ9_9AGAM|nr:hypothetical protein JAAARDRAFT_64721 [Jaapia argillacea MUCL 33604]
MNATTATLPPGVTAGLPPAKDIPATFTASFRSWWSVGEKQSAASEERLLRRLPFFRPSDSSSSLDRHEGPVVATSSQVVLDTPKHYINTLSITPTSPSPSAPPPAILLHGYGAGLGFYIQNFQAMANWAGRRGSSVYALDWLGMGRSARVPFTVKAKREDIPGRVKEAETFFVDSLEEWRQRMGLEKMTLVGHSLGAYFSVVYALKYPTRVHKLILLSPAGVPRDPNETSTPSRELTDEGVEGGSSSDHAETATKDRVQGLRKEQSEKKREESRTRRFLMHLWEEGWSPFQIVRSSIFWAPMLVGKYTSRRFTGLTEEETKEMHDYILNITLAKGSGEYCISHILAPGAHARMPLVDRVAALKIPITFVYGDHDWMDPAGGTQSVENLRKAGNGEGRMYIVPHAGHHVYLDNPPVVNDLIVKELDRPVD